MLWLKGAKGREMVWIIAHFPFFVYFEAIFRYFKFPSDTEALMTPMGI